MAVFMLAVVCGANAWAQIGDGQSAVPHSQQQMQLSFAPVVKQVSPAVVNIYTKRTVSESAHPFMNDPLFAPFFRRDFFGGQMRKKAENSLGSGVIVGADGLVVTNAHVIREAAEIKAVLTDGREFEAQMILSDDASDVALLQIDAGQERLPFALLSPSENLQVGDLVLAIGNPFGVGQTVTSGIVSALARSSLNINNFNFFIQTDAAINPGNSGGALVDLNGGVVGINSAIYSRSGGSLGIGFAIPSEMVASVIAAAQSGQKGERGIIRPWLGARGQSVTAEIARSLGLERPAGVLLGNLHDASPLKKAGAQTGDIVMSINGHDIRDGAEMKFRMATVALGEAADFVFMRKGEEKTLSVVAMGPPDLPPREEVTLVGAHALRGVLVANLNPAVAVELGLDDRQAGVVVMDIADGNAGRSLVRAGDIIVDINGREINDTRDVEPALALSQRGLSMTINSGGHMRKVVMR